MASFKLHVGDRMPTGTVVGAYLRNEMWMKQDPQTHAPPGIAASTATVDFDGSLTFTGLEGGAQYLAAVAVSGVWQYVSFQTDPVSELDQIRDDLDALSGVAAGAATGATVAALATRMTAVEAAVYQLVPPVMIVYDTWTQGAAVVDLTNHTSDIASLDGSPSWERHPQSVGTLFVGGATAVLANRCWNDSASSRSISRHLTPPGTCDYSVIVAAEVVAVVTGHSFGACARMSATLETYYQAYVFVSDAGNLSIRLQKAVGGTHTVLSETIVKTGLPAVGSKWRVTLDCSNEEKVAYTEELLSTGPDVWGPKTRRCTSGDNTIPEAGFAGVSVLRCDVVGGIHGDTFEVDFNGAEAQSGQSQAPTADPVQAPAVLWTPDYTGGASDTLAQVGVKWRVETEPLVRGVQQTTRMSIVAGGSVPGSGIYKPAQAMRVELRAFHNNDLTITATAGATDVATTITVSSGDRALMADKDLFQNVRTGEVFRVNGTPSGTSIPVLRHQKTTAVAILNGDTFTVWGGDVSDSGNDTDAYVSNRAEVYDRWGPTGGTAPAAWPDPQGSVRFYKVWLYTPSDFPAGNSGDWCTLIQWKGNYGGSPPRSLEYIGSSGTLELGGTRSHVTLGSVNKGTWTELIFGFRWETTGLDGWVTVYRDGALVIPKRFEATMDFKFNNPANGADPIYLKQGIYRTALYTTTMVVHYAAPVIGTTLASVQ